MATRTPKKTTAATPAKPRTATPVVLTCPECGKTFTRAAAMGAHRSRIHGVAGSSKNTRRTRTTTAAKPAARTSRTSTRRRAATPAANGRSSPHGSVDRDTLLKMLFPNGIPARQDTIAAVNDWLNEADRLSRL